MSFKYSPRAVAWIRVLLALSVATGTAVGSVRNLHAELLPHPGRLWYFIAVETCIFAGAFIVMSLLARKFTIPFMESVTSWAQKQRQGPRDS